MLRGSAGTPERVEEYRIGAGPDTTVLDALVDVQRTQDPTLAFRYACRVGMCGSCAMVVNGRERWAPRPDAARAADVPSGSRARREIDAAIECIGCGMCLSACTIVAHNPRFPGPAALNRAFTLELDPRDDGQAARWRVLLSDDALARCHGQGNCTEVCPMDLRPMRSIVRLRQRAALRLLRLRPRRP